MAGKGKGGTRLRDPSSVRRGLKKLPETERRNRALALVDELDRRAQEYERRNRADIDAYIAMAARHDTSSSQLIAQRRGADAAFEQALEALMRVRQSLLDTLTEEEWRKVFG